MATANIDVKPTSAITEEIDASTRISSMDRWKLRAALLEFGCMPGPIVTSTRIFYETKLMQLKYETVNSVHTQNHQGNILNKKLFQSNIPLNKVDFMN